jgi:DNA primase
VNGPIPAEKIEEIKSRADIVAVISDYVTLKKAGKNLLGLCPFHSEKTPSFTVTPDKQIYYCFGCGEGGNAVNFLMKIAHLSFPEAVRHLARKTGVVIPERALSSRQQEELSAREQITRLNQTAGEYFIANLASPEGTKARIYLEGRGIQPSAVKEFRLGFAPEGWHRLRDYLARRKVPHRLAEEAGLVIARTEREGAGYDRFRGRLMFPIEDVAGRTIAFGGRIIGEGDPKYMNSPESPVYTKGRNLYGLSRTKEALRKAGFAVLVEGYFDLISLWNAGITNVVATLGTALTKEQVELLRRYVAEVAVVFDPDEAGKKALGRSLELFLAGNVSGKAVVLPAGYDPDSYVRAFGGAHLEELIGRAPSLVDYYVECVIGSGGTLEHDREALEKAVSLLMRIDDALARNLLIRRIAEGVGIDQDLLKKEVARRTRTSPRTPAGRPRAQETDGVDTVAVSLLHVLLTNPELIADAVAADILAYIADDDVRRLGERLFQAAVEKDRAGLTAATFIEGIENAPIRTSLLKLMTTVAPPAPEVVGRLLADTMTKIKEKWYKQQKVVLSKQLASAQKTGDGELCRALLIEKDRLLREEKGLQAHTHGPGGRDA